MARQRFGVALLIPAPAAGEIDVLRRALGVEDLDRLAPHLTLVPPVNVRDDEVDDALDLLRDAALRTAPIHMVLGPPRTFLPINPVLFLEVGGDVAAVDRLRDRIFRPPLERTLTWPFQPHVTLLEESTPDRIRAAAEALADWRTEIVIDRVHLLGEGRRDDGMRVWRPVAEVPFGEPAVVGRGGLELALEVTTLPPPDAIALLPATITVTGRRRGVVVGVAVGEVGEALAVRHVEVVPDHRGEGIARHLLAALESAANEALIEDEG